MMNGGFQFRDAFTGIGADYIDVFGIDTGIDQQIPTPLNIAFRQIGFGDHANGGDVVGMDKIGREGVLGVHTRTDQNHQPGIHGNINGLTRKKREFNKFSRGVNKIVIVTDHLRFGIFKFFFIQPLHQGGFSAADFAD